LVAATAGWIAGRGNDKLWPLAPEEGLKILGLPPMIELPLSLTAKEVAAAAVATARLCTRREAARGQALLLPTKVLKQ